MYELHIIKSHHWTDKEGPAIDLQAWDDLVDCDPELTPVDKVESNPGGPNNLVTDMTGKHCARWLAPSGEIYWIYQHHLGLISGRGTQELVVKLKEIALKLGARVQGDDGEFYD